MSRANYKQNLSGAYLAAYEKWKQHIQLLFDSRSSLRIQTPLFIKKRILKQSEYLSNFPQHIVQTKSDNDESSDAFLTPASCLHVYGEYEHASLDKAMFVMVEGICARHEEGKWEPPYRLPSFTMLEYVVIGNASEIDAIGIELQETATLMFGEAHIPISCVPATDAFFLSSNEGAKRLQKLKGLKKEFVVKTKTGNVAIASLNLHEDYFGKRFSIHSNNKPAHSLCLAFGLERLSFASVEIWGMDHTRWPTSFRV